MSAMPPFMVDVIDSRLGNEFVVLHDPRERYDHFPEGHDGPGDDGRHVWTRWLMMVGIDPTTLQLPVVIGVLAEERRVLVSERREHTEKDCGMCWPSTAREIVLEAPPIPMPTLWRTDVIVSYGCSKRKASKAVIDLAEEIAQRQPAPGLTDLL